MPATTLVNDGSVFVALGIWAAWTAAASDPTLPLGAALAFAAWKLYDKRNKRNPGGVPAAASCRAAHCAARRKAQRHVM